MGILFRRVTIKRHDRKKKIREKGIVKVAVLFLSPGVIPVSQMIWQISMLAGICSVTGFCEKYRPAMQE